MTAGFSVIAAVRSGLHRKASAMRIRPAVFLALSSAIAAAQAADASRFKPDLRPHAQTDLERSAPRIERGQLVDPAALRPLPQTYPALRAQPTMDGRADTEIRLQLNRDVSLGGSAGPGGVSGNIRFPIPSRR